MQYSNQSNLICYHNIQIEHCEVHHYLKHSIFQLKLEFDLKAMAIGQNQFYTKPNQIEWDLETQMIIV